MLRRFLAAGLLMAFAATGGAPSSAAASARLARLLRRRLVAVRLLLHLPLSPPLPARRLYPPGSYAIVKRLRRRAPEPRY